MTTPTPEEQQRAAEERRAMKERIKAENQARYEAELPGLLTPLKEGMSYNELVMEHQRLRMKIMEMQQLVITGKLPVAFQQDCEGKIVAQIHKVEARVAELQGQGSGAVGKGKGPGF